MRLAVRRRLPAVTAGLVLVLAGCGGSDSEPPAAQSASGDISNSAREPMVYTLTVVTIAGADVAGEDTERVRLRPGESTGFEFPAISRGAAETCSPRLVRVPR